MNTSIQRPKILIKDLSSTHDSFSHTILKILHEFSSCPVQSSSVQSSTVQSSTVQYSTVQYSPVQFSSVQSSAVQSSLVQSSLVQSSPVKYSPVLCGLIFIKMNSEPLCHIQAADRGQPLVLICLSCSSQLVTV